MRRIKQSEFKSWPGPCVQGCHGQGKVKEKQNFFKFREKSGYFVKGQGIIFSVREAS